MTDHTPLTLDSTVSRDQEILFEKVDEEIVMLDLEQGNYFALDEIASEIWENLASPILVADLVTVLMTEFDVAQEDCERDVLTYLADLQQRELLNLHA